MFCHKQLVHSTPRLSAPSCHLLAKINALGTLFTTRHLCLKCLKADHYGNHRCLVENIVPLVFIFPSIWQDGAESLGMETTSCVWFCCCCLYLLSRLALALANNCDFRNCPFFLLYLLNTLSLSPLTFCFEKTHFQEETIEAKIRKNVESECAKRQDALFLNVL